MKQKTIQEVFTDIPSLETERLTLRKILPTDAEDMFEYSANPSVTKYLLWTEHPSLAYTEAYVDYLQTRYAVADYYDWAVVTKAEGKMIGTVGFTSIDAANNTAEIGYVLNPAFWGKGIAAEAVKELLRFGFEGLSLSRISAVCMSKNAASLRVMEKCGMQIEGQLRSAVLAKGKRWDVFLAAITAEDFFAKKPTSE